MNEGSAKTDIADRRAFPSPLLAGYRSFKTGCFTVQEDRYRDLAERGQSPETMVIACSDSRVAPETIFDASPGELFVLRNVANMVPPHDPDGGCHATSAALEFAVLSLMVKHVVVLGHGRCGGVKAALEPADQPLSPGDFVGKWMRLLKEAATTVAQNDGMTAAGRQTALERISIRRTLANLRTFPCVDTLERQGRLTLHGAWFDIAGGELWIMDPITEEFSRAG